VNRLASQVVLMFMKITSIQSELIGEIPFRNAGTGGRCSFVDRLPIHHGFVDILPAGVSAIIVTADLQGRESLAISAGVPLRLLGESLPKRLAAEVLPCLDIPPGVIGVLLAGDFYTVPALDKRGGTGDVSSVWAAFANEFDWVVGVAGNHDLFGQTAAPPDFSGAVHFLDGDRVVVDSLVIAGLSGIPGNPRRPWRRSEDDFVMMVQDLMVDPPHVLLMHDGPDWPQHGYRGLSRVREVMESSGRTLVIRGHKHWDHPLAELSNGTQVLNVDARVVILTEQTK
jgi:Icc protein